MLSVISHIEIRKYKDIKIKINRKVWNQKQLSQKKQQKVYEIFSLHLFAHFIESYNLPIL